MGKIDHCKIQSQNNIKPTVLCPLLLLLLLLLVGSVAQWLARRTRDPAVAGSIPITGHVVIALGKQFTYISSVQFTRLQNGYPAIGS